MSNKKENIMVDMKAIKMYVPSFRKSKAKEFIQFQSFAMYVRNAALYKL